MPKITGLDALTAPAAVDLFAVVDDPAGTPVLKRITLADIFTLPAAFNIVVLDNLADALGIDDGGGLEYLRIISTDANPSVSLFPAGGGIVHIGDTVNAKMTLGLNINQGANDDEAFALKSSDVAHGMTTLAETDTYAMFQKKDADLGGLVVAAFSETTRALEIVGRATGAYTEKAATGGGVILLTGWLADGTGQQQVTADGNLVCILSGTATRFIFDQEGELHSDDVIGDGSDWDEYDDLALASDLSRLPKAKFNEMMRYNAEDFERAGLLTLSTDEDGNRHAFIRHKAMHQFAMCCFAEVYKRMKGYEAALLDLGANPTLLTGGAV